MLRKRKLTLKREAFARAYVGPAKGNGALAYRMAGYSSPNTTTATTGAHKLVTNGDVKDFVEELLAQADDAAKLTPAGIKAGIQSVVREAKDGQTKLRGYELLGRAEGMFKDVQERVDRPDPARVLEGLRGKITADEMRRQCLQHGLDPADFIDPPSDSEVA